MLAGDELFSQREHSFLGGGPIIFVSFGELPCFCQEPGLLLRPTEKACLPWLCIHIVCACTNIKFVTVAIWSVQIIGVNFTSGAVPLSQLPVPEMVPSPAAVGISVLGGHMTLHLGPWGVGPGVPPGK